MSGQPAGGPPTGPPVIPPGVPPAFFIPPPDGDVDKGNTVLGVTWAFAALSIIFFALRVYSRRILTRNIGLEDAIMVAALALILAESALVTKAVEHGIGRHMFFVGPVEFVFALKWQIIAMPFAIIGACVPKLVVTMLILKILNPGKLAAAFLWTLNIILFSISIATSVVALVQCTPTSAQWTHAGEFTCWDPSISTNVGLAQGSFGGLVDFVLALYPITAIWSLQMSLSNKIGVSILMGLGIFSGVGAIVKTVKLTKLTDKNDVTWELWSLVLWVMLELNIVFICACVPAIRPLWAKYSPRLSSTKGSSGTPYAYGSSGKNSFAMRSKGKKLGPEKDIETTSRGSETQLTQP